MKVMVNASGRDWQSTRQLVDKILEREGTLARFISSSLSDLADRAREAAESDAGYKRCVSAVKRMRRALKNERETLISSEVEFLNFF